MDASDYIRLAGGIIIIGLVLAAAGIVWALRRGVRSLDADTRPIVMTPEIRHPGIPDSTVTSWHTVNLEPRRMGDGLAPGQHRAPDPGEYNDGYRA